MEGLEPAVSIPWSAPKHNACMYRFVYINPDCIMSACISNKLNRRTRRNIRRTSTGSRMRRRKRRKRRRRRRRRGGGRGGTGGAGLWSTDDRASWREPCNIRDSH